MKNNEAIIAFAVIVIVVCIANSVIRRIGHDCFSSDSFFDDSTNGTPSIILYEGDQHILTFEDLLDAIEQEESGGDPNAVCPKGCCVGAYQITKIYIDDCNRILRLMNFPDHYTYKDRWDRDKSRFMTNIVTVHYAYKDWKNKEWDMMGYLETAARTHKSPSRRNHESTELYWEKIKERLTTRQGRPVQTVGQGRPSLP